MPEGGASSKELRNLKAHRRVLEGLHESLFAPQFRALETYGRAPPPPPTLADVATAAREAAVWHRSKEAEVAAELTQRREARGNPLMIDEAARMLAHHRREQARIAQTLAELGFCAEAAE